MSVQPSIRECDNRYGEFCWRGFWFGVMCAAGVAAILWGLL